MLRTLALASLIVLALGACASSGVRYVDPAGREYSGAVDPATNTVSAQIGGKAYRGPFTVNAWSQAKATLKAPGGEPLYCNFHYRVLRVKGTCTDLAGGEYTMQSR